MEKQFNGPLRRRSMANTGWLLQACIALAVGVGLMSCTKEQKDEGMIQPTQLSQSLSACQPAGLSSTATPELCVIVTEIQLVSHETKADIELSLVNRTGRRLFVTFIGTSVLTDNSGRKWVMGESKGLGELNNPVPVEPAGDTQGAISFRQNGQAPADLTFSLRGEIGIMKMDSLGQAVPGQIAARRGISLSGIRIQRQQPQATGVTEQNKDVRHAPISTRRVDPPSSKPSASSKSSAPGAVVGPVSIGGKANIQKPASLNIGRSPDQRAGLTDAVVGDTAMSKSGSKSAASGFGPDVMGLRIGLTPDQARKVFKEQGFGVSTKSSNRPFDSYAEGSHTLSFSLQGKAPQSVPNTKYLARISAAIRDVKYPATENSGSIVSVFFGPVPGQEEIVLLNRTEYIPASKGPTFATFTKTLLEKYGTPTEIQPGAPGVYRWRYDNNGTLRKPSLATNFVGCPRLRPGVVEFQPQGSPQMIQEYRQSLSRCGAIFLEVVMGFEGYNYVGPGTLIKDHTTHMSGIDAIIRALQAAKGIVDKAHVETVGVAIKKGQ